MSLIVKVKRKLLVSCMTCPLCHKLLNDATTISECLHSFCRKCIYEKLTNEELVSCPTCGTNLGCTPIEKLRPDNNLQDVRSKIFPFKRRKVEAPELVPSISLPIRRKERSLSSLVINSTRVPPQSALTRRRTKAAGRKIVKGLGVQPPIIKEENLEDCPSISHLPETLRSISQNIRQGSSNAWTSSNGEEPPVDNLEHWKPLKDLVVVANFTDKGSIPETEQVNLIDVKETAPRRSKSREHLRKPRKRNSQEQAINTLRRSGGGRKRSVASRDLKKEKESCPIWLSLVSAPDRQGDALLPQLSSSYLRIKDNSLPVLLVQKYLAKKLDLVNETEVEIFCRGQQVMPYLEIHELVDLWLQTGSSKRAVVLTGSPAENFVMVLTYARRVYAGAV